MIDQVQAAAQVRDPSSSQQIRLHSQLKKILQLSECCCQHLRELSDAISSPDVLAPDVLVEQ